jgi:hypothetical protein
LLFSFNSYEVKRREDKRKEEEKRGEVRRGEKKEKRSCLLTMKDIAIEASEAIV